MGCRADGFTGAASLGCPSTHRARSRGHKSEDRTLSGRLGAGMQRLPGGSFCFVSPHDLEDPSFQLRALDVDFGNRPHRAQKGTKGSSDVSTTKLSGAIGLFMGMGFFQCFDL